MRGKDDGKFGSPVEEHKFIYYFLSWNAVGYSGSINVVQLLVMGVEYLGRSESIQYEMLNGALYKI